MSNTRKQVFLSLETARKMWKAERSVNEPLRSFLLDNYTEEELEAKELPKTWEELGKVKGYYVNSGRATVEFADYSTLPGMKSVFPTKELAEASLALAQLLQLRDVYNGDWKVDVHSKPNENRWIIYNLYNEVATSCTTGGMNYILTFKCHTVKDEFLRNFKDLITIALPLL